MRLAVVIEQNDRNYSAYAPDVPGCGVTAESVEAAKALLAEAVVLHWELDPARTPCRTQVDYIEVVVPAEHLLKP